MAGAQLSIPPRFRSGVETIAMLPTAAVEALRDSLAKSSSPRKVVVDSLAKMDVTDLEKIYRTLQALYAVRIRDGISAEKFAQDLVDNLRRKKPGLLTPDAATAALANFKTLLAIESLEILQREKAVLRSDEKLFCNAAVLVDLRPVFTGPAGDDLRRLVVSYRLKLGFHSDGDRHEDIYLSLDVDDIQVLRESLNQAEMQGEILERQAKKMLRARK